MKSASKPSIYRSESVENLRPDPENARRHGEENLTAVAASLRRFGQQKPIVVTPDGVVIAGNATLEAARRLGWEKVEVVETRLKGSDLSAFAVADNRTAELAEWDHEALLASLRGLGDGEDEFVSEMSMDSLLAVTRMPVEAKEDEAPDPPKKPTTKKGDLWALGDHQLPCGDATDPETYTRIEASRANLVVTDPPYGVGIGKKNRDLGSLGKAGRVKTDMAGDVDVGEVAKVWSASSRAMERTIKPGTTFYIFGPQGGDLGLLILSTLRDCGIGARHILIWRKNRPSFSIGRLDYDYAHEPILYGWKPGAAHSWHASTPKTSILEFDRPSASRLHPTMKPVKLLVELIGNSTKTGNLVLDPFGGSGSTISACEQSNRRCSMSEIDESYCDVIVERWQNLTGKSATRKKDG